jgi:hypothetical protein
MVRVCVRVRRAGALLLQNRSLDLCVCMHQTVSVCMLLLLQDIGMYLCVCMNLFVHVCERVCRAGATASVQTCVFLQMDESNCVVYVNLPTNHT